MLLVLQQPFPLLPAGSVKNARPKVGEGAYMMVHTSKNGYKTIH